MSTVGIKGLFKEVLELKGGADAPVAPPGRLRFRYNETTMQPEVSVDQGAYVVIGTGGGGSPWIEAGSVVRLDDITNDVAIGAAAPVGTEKLFVDGDARIDNGSLLVSDITTAPASGADLDLSSDSGIVAVDSGDNLADAFTVSEGANRYIGVTTTNGSEAINLANGTTNPDVNILGTGDFNFSTGPAVFPERVGDPGATANTIKAYAKDVAGTTEFFLQDSAGNVVQVTSGGGVVAGAAGANTQVQYNSAGALAANADFTYDGTNVTLANDLFADGGVDTSGAGTLAIGGTNATTIDIGGTQASVDVQLVDNTPDAFLVRQGTNDYIDVDTTDGIENVVIGNTATNPSLFFRAASDSQLEMSPDVLWEVPDNTANVFRLASGGGSDTYIQLTTTNLAEELAFGTTNTNPDFNFRGTGDFRLSGGGVDGSALRITRRTADPAVGISNDGTLYTKLDGSGDAQLWFEDGNGVATRITEPGGGLNVDLSSYVGTADFDIPDNTSQAFLVHEGTNEYIECTTHNGASILRFGNVGGAGDPNTIQFALTTGQSGALQMDAGGNIYFKIDTIGGTKLQFGNGATDPSFEFVGDGPVQLGTAGGHNNFLRILDRTGDPAAAAGAGDIYTKDTGGITELFYQDDTNQVTQLTSNNQIGAAASAAYTRNATIVEDRTLLASASATTTNNNNVLAALIGDLQAKGILG